MSYPINFTDPTKPPITVADVTGNASDTSLTFVGKQQSNYAQVIGENFLHLLENFASEQAPFPPTVGQLWFNSSEGRLKIYDGFSWKPASGINRSSIRPSGNNSVAGDLWVDSNNQQLYLFTGDTWSLIGPQFSAGLLTGIQSEEILDSSTQNLSRPIISMVVGGKKLAIFSVHEFTPATTIPGFSKIYRGITLSSDTNSDITKFWGTSEKSDALVIGGSAIPASKFLRSDAVNTTAYAFNIKDQSGLGIGPFLETSITSTSNGTIITQKSVAAPIIMRTTGVENNSPVTSDVVVVASNQVGINTTPTVIPGSGTVAALDVNGSGAVSGEFYIGGPLTVTQDLSVAGNTDLMNLSVGAVLPKQTLQHDIGSSSLRFNNVHAKNIVSDTITGELTGSLIGDVTGNVSGSAGRLRNITSFRLDGDVTSTVLPYNGEVPALTSTVVSVSRANNVATVVTAGPHSFLTDNILTVVISGADQSFNTTNARISLVESTNNAFTYVNQGPDLGTTSVTGSCSITTVSTFQTDLSSFIIDRKQELTTAQGSDYFLVYRASATPPLRKIKQSTVFSSFVQVPVGAIMAYTGDSPPAGAKFCDGSTVRIADYPELYAVIRHKYNPALSGSTEFFGLPDFRGRTLLGADDMGGTAAGRVPGATPGVSGGAATQTLTVNQLPQHSHDLKGSAGTQFYALANVNATTDQDAVAKTISYTTGKTMLLPDSGGIKGRGSLQQAAINMMNPYQTVNYIIFTGTQQ